MADKRFAYVCSPFRGDAEANSERARGYSRQVYETGYTPLTPHLLFPQFLNDGIAEERAAGIEMSNALLARCSLLVVCGDKISEGMAAEIKLAEELNITSVTLAQLTAAERKIFNERSVVMNNGNGESHVVDYSERFSPIQAYIENETNRIGKWQSFPATKENIQEMLKEIGADGLFNKSLKITEFETQDSYLHMRLPLDADINELNYLAVKLRALKGHESEIFEAVVEADRHCDSIKDIINIIENFDCFDLQPAFDAEQYGEFMLEVEKDNTSAVFDRLEKSADSDERAFAKYIVQLEKNVDEAAYGRSVAEKEKGVFTEHGYLTEGEGFEEIYHGQEDIPTVYHLYNYSESESFIKVENTDLSVLLLKMHALGGSYMTDAQYNLNILAEKQSEDYLLLMNGSNIFLTETIDAYRRGMTPYEIWTNAEDNPDTRAFAIHVSDQHGNGVIGDLVEINLAECQNDILHNSVYYTEIYATLKDGSEKKYLADAWDSLDTIVRDRVQKYTEKYDLNDISAVVRHLAEIRGGHSKNGKSIEPDVLLLALNKTYMEKAPNPQPGMIRIYQTAAKEMLARSDAKVYSLLPEGAKLLTPVDAVKYGSTLRYPGHAQFAVKKEDLAGIDKWAKREVEKSNAKRQAEREAGRKSKSNEEEH